jgi:small subunit ribosomal protein S10
MIMNTKIRIRLKAYDHKLLDQSAIRYFGYCAKKRGKSRGPDTVADPNQQILCAAITPRRQEITRAVRDADPQTLLDILEPTQQTVDALMKLDLSPGVDVEIKL